MKIKFTEIIFTSSSIFLTLYIFLFILYPANSSYFTCNELIQSKFINTQISYFIPVSCDLELYMTGVYDIGEIYKFDYNYQSRPLYILYIKVIYELLGLLISNELVLKFLTFFFAHLLIISVSINLFFLSIKKLQVKIDKVKFNYIILFISLFPIIKWGIFDASHQTLTFLQFAISFHFLIYKYEEFGKIYLFSFLLGLLALSNLTFALPLFFLVFHKINSLSKVLKNFGKLTLTSMLFLVPILSWNIFIRSQGYIPYNAATTYWYQFIWLKDYILAGYENVNFNPESSEYFCMSVPLFLKCYLNDFLRSLIYLFPLPILCILSYRNSDKAYIKIYSLAFKNLFLIFLISFSFWAFIGWYPPLRFNLYSVGSFLVLLFCLSFSLIHNSNVIKLTGLTYSIYFLFLNHWNFLGVVNINFGILLSFIFLVVLFFITYKRNSKRATELS
mgnify:CR=1 FL=1